MYFKKLELIGFKSFLDKTTLQFEPGITAVVGPNGSGKSNLLDGIRWVLGEQSAKSLRGSQMEDVIFNGTDLKEPLGMAEVSLTFDNQQRFFNFDHNEVCITRRIFRSGESEYLLNKNLMRLKDIQDLLMGTGVGAESYSIVAQGKIDLVLSSRPEERRLVFDEASGITKYKGQKKESLRRLQETEQNLLRVNDIIAEVGRQIASLQRQANKARKYKEVFTELKSRELDHAFIQRRSLFRERDENIVQLEILEARQEEFLNLIREEESRISNRQAELKIQEERMMAIKNRVLELENQISRANQHIGFNKEKIIELSSNETYLQKQIVQLKARSAADEEKLEAMRQQYGGLKEKIDEKSLQLQQKEAQLNSLASSIKKSLDAIAAAKKLIMEMAVKIANTRNEITDFGAKEQIYIARKKRLELERLKAAGEKAAVEENLSSINLEVQTLKKTTEEAHSRIEGINSSLKEENLCLDGIDAQIAGLEKQVITLYSHREFLEKLKTKYEDISESMNAVIYLDKAPIEKISGLVVKIHAGAEVNPAENLCLSGEAKPIELDTQKIQEQIKKLEEEADALKNARQAKKARIQQLDERSCRLQEEIHAQQIALSNKETSRASILEQFNKLKDEEELMLLELEEAQSEISLLKTKTASCQEYLLQLNNQELRIREGIAREEENISLNSKAREEALMAITQFKTELEALNKRIDSDRNTLKILEEAFLQGQESLNNSQRQVKESQDKTGALESEIREGEVGLQELGNVIELQNSLLKESEDKYQQVCAGADDYVKKVEWGRGELDSVKKSLHQLQMRQQEIEYKYTAMKERMLSAYKIDLQACGDTAEEVPAASLSEEIAALKKRLDSYGTVNLVAIEEYDELKKRYDFLIQQQNDLNSAKESLHQAILKINRTTKQIFLETFEKVKVEFRNYFRLLFNGGDAQLFLVDEGDPLESGIEIICRPPGKKLQNVLLLSGGEKSMSAIALIFAIFKIKPSPFCILDEIDAALDEANVDRFGLILQEFAKASQFIVITHNKKTIVNANVMYGITMEQSGVSKIVSVKFAEDKSSKKDKTLDADMAVV
ncbi:MAG: AAA family ATPase [Candidatus Omnitrophota bacterium]